MVTILQLSQQELREELRNFLRESIEEIRSIPAPAPAQLPDQIDLAEACKEVDLSESQVYKLTMLKEIPFSKYGKRLVFSRKALREWKHERTKPSATASEIMTDRLARGAKKQSKK
jgi:excisionase family DNA binding protein